MLGLSTGGGGFSGSSSASAKTGDATIQPFVFSPSSGLSTGAWIAIGIAGALALLLILKR